MIFYCLRHDPVGCVGCLILATVFVKTVAIFFVHIAKIQVLKFIFVHKFAIKKILISKKILT